MQGTVLDWLALNCWQNFFRATLASIVITLWPLIWIVTTARV